MNNNTSEIPFPTTTDKEADEILKFFDDLYKSNMHSIMEFFGDELIERMDEIQEEVTYEV